MRRLLQAFSKSGVSAQAIERFLDAEPSSGSGSVRDHVAAEMANQLLDALGQPASQDPQKTADLRRRGAWRRYDERPEE